MALHVSTDGLLSVHGQGGTNSPPTPDDQDEGEVVFHLLPKSSPRLPRRSSNDDLEVGGAGTEPTSPMVPPSPSTGSPRRRVSFADHFGLELTAVKFYDEAEVPEVPEAMLDPLRDETDDDVAMRRLTLRFRSCDVTAAAANSSCPIASPSSSKGHLFLKPTFEVPSGSAELLAEVRAKQVALESVTVEEDDPLCVRILMRVRNICYHKAVFVRRTFDGWSSFYDLLAEYVPGSNDGDTDQFAFRLALPPPLALEGTAMEFAVRFETPLGSFWANNEQVNYSIVCCWADEVDGMPVAVAPPADEEHADKNLRSCLKTKSWESSPETLQAEAISDDMKANDLANLDPLHPSRLKPSSSMENFVPLQLTVTSPSGEEKVLDRGNRELRLQVGGPEGLSAESPADAGEIIKTPEKRSRFSRNKRIAALCKKMKDEGGMHALTHIDLDYTDGNDKAEDSSSEATSPTANFETANFEADSENNNLSDNANLLTHRDVDADARNDNLTTAEDADAGRNAGPDGAAPSETGAAWRRVELAKMSEVEVGTVQTVVRSELPVVTKLDDGGARVLVQDDDAGALAGGCRSDAASPRGGGAEGSAADGASAPPREPDADFNMNVRSESDAATAREEEEEAAAVAATPPLHRPTEGAYSHYESYEDLRIRDEAETSPGSAADADDVPALLGDDGGTDAEGNAAGTDRPGTSAEGRSEKDARWNYAKDEPSEALDGEMEFDAADEPQAPVDADDYVVVAAAADKAAVTECDVSVQTEDASLYEEVLPVDPRGGEYLTDMASIPLQAFEPADVCFSTFVYENRAPLECSECDTGDADAVEQHRDSSPNNDSAPRGNVGEWRSEESVPAEEQVGMDLSGDDAQVDEEFSKEAAPGESESVQESHDTSEDESITPTNTSQEHESAKGDVETDAANVTSEDSWGDDEMPALESSTEGALPMHPSLGKSDAETTVGDSSLGPSEAGPSCREHAGPVEAGEREAGAERALPGDETSSAGDRPPLWDEPRDGRLAGDAIAESPPVSAAEPDEGGAGVEAPRELPERDGGGPAAEALAEIADAFDEQVEERLPESEEIICSEPHSQLRGDPLLAAAAVPSEAVKEDVSDARVSVEIATGASPDAEDNRCVLQSAVLELDWPDSPSAAEEDVDDAPEAFSKVANEASRVNDASTPYDQPVGDQPVGDQLKIVETTDVEQNFSSQESEPAVREYPSYSEHAPLESVTDDLLTSSTPRVAHVHHKHTEEHDGYLSNLIKEQQEQPQQEQPQQEQPQQEQPQQEQPQQEQPQQEQPQQQEGEEVEVDAADVPVTIKIQMSHMGEESVKRYFESGEADARFAVGASDVNLQYDEVPMSEFMSADPELGEALAGDINEEISVASVVVEPGSCNLSDVEEDADLDQSIDEIPDLEHYMEQFKPNDHFSDVATNIQAIQGALLGATRPLIEPPDGEAFEALPSALESQLVGFESTEVKVSNRPFLESFLTIESHVMTEQPDQLWETPDLTPEVKYQYELEFPKAPNQTQWFPEPSAAPGENIDDLQKLKETGDIETTPPVERAHWMEEHWPADCSVTDSPASDKVTPSSVPRQESGRGSERAFGCDTHEPPAEEIEDFDALVEPIIPREQLNRIMGMVEENVKRFLEANSATLQVTAEDATFAGQWSLGGTEGDCAEPRVQCEGETVPTARHHHTRRDEVERVWAEGAGFVEQRSPDEGKEGDRAEPPAHRDGETVVPPPQLEDARGEEPEHVSVEDASFTAERRSLAGTESDRAEPPVRREGETVPAFELEGTLGDELEDVPAERVAEQLSLEGSKEGDPAEPRAHRNGETAPTAEPENAREDELVAETSIESTNVEPPLKPADFDTAADTFAPSREAHDWEASAGADEPTLSPLTSAEPPVSKDDGTATPELESVDQWLRETPPLLRRRPVNRISGQLDENSVSPSPPEQNLAEEEAKQVKEEVPVTNRGDEDVSNDDTDAGVDLQFETEELDLDLEPRVTHEELIEDVDLLEEDADLLEEEEEEEQRYPHMTVAESQLEEATSGWEQEQAASAEGKILLRSIPQVQLQSGFVSGFVLAEPEVEVPPVSDETEAVGVKSDAVEAGCPDVSNARETVAEESRVEEAQVSQRSVNELPASTSETSDIAAKVEPEPERDSSRAFGGEEQRRETWLLTEVGEIRDILQSMLVEVNQSVEEFSLQESAEATTAAEVALASVIEEPGEAESDRAGNAPAKHGGGQDDIAQNREEARSVEAPPLAEQPDSHAPQNPGDAFAATADDDEESAKQPVPDANRARPKPRRPRPAFPTVIVNEVIPEEDESRASVEEDSSAPGAPGWESVTANLSAAGAAPANSSSAAAEASRSYTRLQQVFEKVLYFLAFVVFLVALYHYDIVVCCALYVVSLGVLYYENEITESGQRQFQE